MTMSPLTVEQADEITTLLEEISPDWSCPGTYGDFGWTVRGPAGGVETEDSEQGKIDAEFIGKAPTFVRLLLAAYMEVDAHRCAQADRIRELEAERDLTAIRAALRALPSICRYHGDKIEPPPGLWPREACCDTGVPALRRRRAEAELERLGAIEQPIDTTARCQGCTASLAKCRAEGGRCCDLCQHPVTADTNGGDRWTLT